MNNILGKITGILMLFIFILACADSGDTKQTASVSAADEALSEQGKKVFKTYCVLCHGADGKLGLNGALDMSISTLSLEERIEVITNGRNTMVPYKGVLEEDEIKAVATYTLKFKSNE